MLVSDRIGGKTGGAGFVTTWTSRSWLWRMSQMLGGGGPRLYSCTGSRAFLEVLGGQGGVCNWRLFIRSPWEVVSGEGDCLLEGVLALRMRECGGEEEGGRGEMGGVGRWSLALISGVDSCGKEVTSCGTGEDVVRRTRLLMPVVLVLSTSGGMVLCGRSATSVWVCCEVPSSACFSLIFEW